MTGSSHTPSIGGGDCLVMGVVNVTPDSFSDGGRYADTSAAIGHALAMIDEGADIVDIGGESTRPGAPGVSEAAELDRVIPVIEGLRRQTDRMLSIDTSKPVVMREAVAAGATLINDVNALRTDGALECAVAAGVPVCLMHMLGEPRTMQASPEYDDVVTEVADFLASRARICEAAGIAASRIIIDPGIGFGKRPEHNLALIRQLDRLVSLGYPVLVGVSRKSLIGHVTGRSVNHRLAGSLAFAMLARQRGAAILRVHDVAQTVDALRVLQAVETGTQQS